METLNPTKTATPMSKCRYGMMTFNRNDVLAGESLSHYGEWAEQELDVLGSLLAPGQNVLEVGGNLAAQTLWFSRTVGPNGQVYVVEPQRLDFQYLCANAALNGLLNVHAYPMALGRESTTIQMATYDPARPYRHARNLDDSAGRSESVNVNTADSLKLDSLALIKINAPHDPVAVLSGAVETIKRNRPAIYFQLGQLDQARKQTQFTKDLGYELWSHIAYLHNAQNTAGTQQNIFPGQVLQNLLAIPVEKALEFPDLVKI